MPGLLEAISELFDRAWEDLVYDPCSRLPTLFEVDSIDGRWIAYQKGLLGFTDDLSFEATVTELRRILSNAIQYWNDKPSELGVISDAIRMVTGNRFRAANWFDFRMQIDTTVITEELEDFDPYVLGFPTQKFSGSLISIDAASGFSIDDLTLPQGFEGAHQFGWLIIRNSAKVPSNDGIYKIDGLQVGTGSGTIVGAFPNGPELTSITWELLGYAAEYTTEVRLVDPGVGTLAYRENTIAFTVGGRVFGGDSGAYGTIVSDANDGDTGVLSLKKINGRFVPHEPLEASPAGSAVSDGKLLGVLNRDLLAFLMLTVKPFSERIDVVYINFLDQFLVPGDTEQWGVVSGTFTVPSPGGVAVLASGGRVQDADPNSPDWGDQVTAWKFVVEEATGVAEFTFMGTDELNHYFVRIDYSTKLLSLWRKVSGANTQIGSSVFLAILKPGVQEVIRVDALAEGSSTRIRVKLAGELRIDEPDTTGAFSAGRVGMYASSGILQVLVVEVNVLPTEVQRVGPLP